MKICPSFDPATQIAIEEWAEQPDGTLLQAIRNKTADEIKADKVATIRQQLADSDHQFDPRWHEDARNGTAPQVREQVWLSKRADLRTKLAALMS